MTLMCMAKRPDVFRLGLSFSPVSLWEAYDTGYTERYMGLPKDNVEGYKEGSVLTHVAGFPDEPNRLVVFHGLEDENVHFCHTSMLIEKLVQNMKPYLLQVYPGDRHGISNPASNFHSLQFFFRHILQHL